MHYAVSPNPVDVRFNGDDDIDLHVVTTAGCAWTAASQASWITITGAGSGSGDGHVRIAVAPTLAVSGRVGTLSIGGADGHGQPGRHPQPGSDAHRHDLRPVGIVPEPVVHDRRGDDRRQRRHRLPRQDDCSDLRNGVPPASAASARRTAASAPRRIDRIGDDDDDILTLPEEEE